MAEESDIVDYPLQDRPEACPATMLSVRNSHTMLVVGALQEGFRGVGLTPASENPQTRRDCEISPKALESSLECKASVLG